MNPVRTQPIVGRPVELVSYWMLLAFVCFSGSGCRPTSPTTSTPVAQHKDAEENDAKKKDVDWVPSAEPTGPHGLMARVRNAMARGDEAEAERVVSSLLISHPNDVESLEFAGDLAATRSKSETAVELYQRAIELSAAPRSELMDKIGQQQMSLGRPFDSLESLERIVALYPDNAKARVDLAGLLGSLGLQRRAAEHLRYLVQHQQAGLSELIWLTDLNRPQTDQAICEYAIKQNPGDLRPSYALASTLAYKQDWPAAKSLLEPLCDQQPQFVEAWACLGRVLVELDDEAGIAKWASSLPTKIESDSQYWIAAGLWSERHKGSANAARAYWNASRLNENDSEALNRLGNCLVGLGRIDEAKRVRRRAAMITAMRDDVESLFSWRNHSQRAALAIAKSMKSLGRIWEAATWARIAVMMSDDPDESAASVFAEIRQSMNGRSPWQAVDSLVTSSIDVSDLPAPQWKPSDKQARPVLAEQSSSEIRFADEAGLRGLHHTVEIDKPEGEESGMWIYQSGAGGAGVIDYDADGWPDFYLTSCDGLPKQLNSKPNRLHRNLNSSYSDVTTASGVGDFGFAQGVAVGDFNSDGFPDLMIANFGTNRLLGNNGDGTFTDVTEKAGLSGDQWTTSVAIADFDGDAIADLFEVNYIGGDDVIRRKCFPDGGGEHRSCGPLVFPAEKDRVWRGRGDGTFSDASHLWLDDQDPGRGLGLIVGMLDEQPGIDVYVANDMTANHFWSSNRDGDGDFRFSEQAAPRGLAFNERSVSQASMGIAADDADGDGDLDFYVTHFFDDYNTLYTQVDSGVWSDRTSASGLVSPTNPMLGFGTQWIDADNDGSVELAVANGNVDDFSSNGHAFRMPMQFFQRTSTGRYAVIGPVALGPYFQSMRLGRALVTVDANRDSRVDLLVTHLFDPVSLLINQSSSRLDEGSSVSSATNNSLRLYLVGSHSHRDAVGATVSVQVGGKVQVRQRLSGNGYQCANEPCLHFGLGDAKQVDRIEVQWTSGERQEAFDLPTNQSYWWIEGQSPFPIPTPFPIPNVNESEFDNPSDAG